VSAENPERVRSALQSIYPSNRDHWVKVAFAIRSEYDEEGFDMWAEWGAGHERPASEVKATWRSAKTFGGTTINTLFGFARANGWTDTQKYKRPTAAEIAQRKKAAVERNAALQVQLAAEHEAAAEVAASRWAEAIPAVVHPYLSRKGIMPHGTRIGKWSYDYTDRQTGEIITVLLDNCLLIPIQDSKRKIHTIQCIEPGEGKAKRYLRSGAKSGYFFPVGKKPLKTEDDRPIFVLAEGFATAASVHEGSGHMVLTCFDTSNLKPVAETLRAASPGAVIIIAADNDQGREDGSNPGVKAARAAALAVGGMVCIPALKQNPAAPCDFNDLFLAEGPEPVRLALAGTLLSPSVEVALDPPVEEDEPPLPEGVQPALPLESGPDDVHAAKYFAILGYDGDSYYFFHHAKKQVLTRSRGDFSDIGLVELAPRQWWESFYPGSKGGIDRIAAAEWMFGLANARGIYDVKRVRGRGAWVDKGRLVFHHGDMLTVDGIPTAVTDIKSGYVYPLARAMPPISVAPATDEQGEYLVRIAKLVRWTMPASAALMAGWVFLAPVCGALKWRPHIWITGPAGSGKSTIQSDYCQALVRGISEYFQGDSSGAGIRQDLGSDAVPTLIDELEPNDERDRARISSILTMIRQSSSESMAKTAKGTVSGAGMHFHIRSMFCVASINTMLDKDSDSSRLTQLVIRTPATSGGAEDRWHELEENLHMICKDEDWSGRLLARSLALLPTILASVDVFTRVAAAHFGTQRHGDQFGTLLAGTWCLTHSSVPSESQARDLIASYDWSEHHGDGAQDDPTKALMTLMEARLKVAYGEVTVFELVADASGQSASKVTFGDGVSVDTLNRHGMRIVGNEIVFANSSPSLRGLVEKTPYFSDLKGQLLRVPGANKFGNKTLKFSGLGSKCVAVPLSVLFEIEDSPL
jgi:putative DNA primase/helicase